MKTAAEAIPDILKSWAQEARRVQRTIKDDLGKVPTGLSLEKYYTRIFDWHKNNQSREKGKCPYSQCYRELVAVLPQPKDATLADIVFVCTEVISGLMEWAYDDEDS